MKKKYNMTYSFTFILVASLILNLNVSAALEQLASSSVSNEYYLADPENENILFNVTLLISNWLGNIYLRGLNVTIYDSDGNLISFGQSNNTGHFNATLEKKSYKVIIRDNNRVVGWQEIHVNAPGIILVKTWAYELNVTCIDLENNIIPGVVVLLHDQSNVTEAKHLVWVSKTNEEGIAAFRNVWNGTYKIVVEAGKIIGEKTVKINEPAQITVKCNRTSLEFKIISSTSALYPLSNASVLLQDSTGQVALKGRTDKNGYVKFSNLFVDNYTVFVDWNGVEVFSGMVNTELSKSLEITAPVFEVALRVTDPLGRPIPKSKIVLKRVLLRRVASGYLTETLKSFELESDEDGFLLCLLPSGTYEISCSSGIYFGKTTISLTNNYSGVLQCSIQFNAWLLLFLVSLPLSVLSFLLESRRLKKPLEYKRYQSMLSKLEAMYSNGLVEYKIYRKLKEEYETKLMELGGRRRR